MLGMADPVTFPERVPSARDLLAFYLESGVDCALGDEPVNRLSDDAEPAPRPSGAPHPLAGPSGSRREADRTGTAA